MFAFFLAILVVMVAYDGIRTIYAQAVVEAHNPYKRYRELLNENKNIGGN